MQKGAIRGCTFKNNSARNPIWNPEGIYLPAGALLIEADGVCKIENNVFKWNSGSYFSGTIDISGTHNVNIKGNTFIDNYWVFYMGGGAKDIGVHDFSSTVNIEKNILIVLMVFMMEP